MKQHQDHILAIKDRIKPGFCSVIFKAYTEEMLMEYLRSLKDQIRHEEERQKF